MRLTRRGAAVLALTAALVGYTLPVGDVVPVEQVNIESEEN